MGSLRSNTEVYNAIEEEGKPSVKSINKNNIIKVCHLFSPFFFDKNNRTIIHDPIIYENSTNSKNILKVQMSGDSLNSFDLYIFLCVLKEYKKHYDNFTYEEISLMDFFEEDFYIFDTDLPSLIKLSQYRNCGSTGNRILASLGKLSRIHIDMHKNYKSQKYERYSNDNITSDSSYSFTGNLLSFKKIRTKCLIQLKIYLSVPLFKIFQSDQYYSLINWHSLSLLPNNQLRHLYFYFCLNVKVSRFFTEFTVDDLVNKLFRSPPHSSMDNRKRRQLLRKLCHFFYNNQELFQDFNFQLSFKNSTNIININKVRRCKLYMC